MYNISEEMKEEVDQADILFIGGEGGFKQWSVRQEKVTKEYSDIMEGRVYSMVQTNDKNYLFFRIIMGV